MKNQEDYQHAKKRVELKLGFRLHFAVYVGVITLLLIINLSTSNDYLWVKWPAFGWGIGIILHGLNAYAFPDSTILTDKMIRKEMEKGNKA